MAGATTYLLYRWHRRRSGRDCSRKSGADGPRIEEGVVLGSHVVAKLRDSWATGSPYVYGRVDRREPLAVVGARGARYLAGDLEWVLLAEDDGWLAPHGLDWQQPGRPVLMQLMDGEWVSARVAADHRVQPVRARPLRLGLAGVDGLASVCIQTDVAYLFTPHEECLIEFGHAQPSRGGRLFEHIADAFKPEERQEGETEDEAIRRQRQRWVEKSRSDGQYPLRSVWVHPGIKEGALNEFARRARNKCLKSKHRIRPEVVMLVGPPAAGKSSVSRLPPDQFTGPLAPVLQTAKSLQYREEVNNDNLTDCMPGFAYEYKHALAIRSHEASPGIRLWKKAKSVCVRMDNINVASRLQWIRDARESELSAEAWALQWLSYLVYHHGPVRDSLALDVIRVTIVDAAELPVYYSSCMAGKAMGRSMLILELSHSSSRPVPHRPLAFRGFWPYTSQESRFDRQTARADDEKRDGQLKGGNLTSNLVDMHYHAQQAETNITRMLDSLHRGLRPSDERDDGEATTDISVDHFLVIDNEGKQPKVLIDFACQDKQMDENIQSRLASTVETVISERRLFEKVWDDFDRHLFRICLFFLEHYEHDEHHPTLTKARSLRQQMNLEDIPADPIDVLPMVTEIDEEVFFRKYGERSTATDTDQYRGNDHKLGDAAREALAKEPDQSVESLKQHLSVLRKYTCLAILKFIKNEGDWVDELQRQASMIA